MACLSPDQPVPRSLIEARLASLVADLAPPPAEGRGPGRPAILPATLLWTALAVGVLRGFTSQQALWRLLSLQGVWAYPRVPVSDKALSTRIASDGPGVLADLFPAITAVLLDTVPDPPAGLAPFAP